MGLSGRYSEHVDCVEGKGLVKFRDGAHHIPRNMLHESRFLGLTLVRSLPKLSSLFSVFLCDICSFFLVLSSLALRSYISQFLSGVQSVNPVHLRLGRQGKRPFFNHSKRISLPTVFFSICFFSVNINKIKQRPRPARDHAGPRGLD